MYRSAYLRKFLIGAAAVGGSADADCDKLKRPSELPIYTPVPKPVEFQKSQTETEEPSELEKKVGVVRKEIWVYYDKIQGYKDKVVHVIETGKAHSESLLDSLRQEELPVPRAGAVVLSGLAGVVLGLRGGWIRRIFYGSTSAAIMAALCYPKEFQEITQDGVAEGKKYVMIGYNFIYGVKPEGLALPSPSQVLGGSQQPPTTKEGKPAKADVTVADIPEEKPNSLAVPLPELTKPTLLNDQSNPADKDLYSNRS